MFNGNSQHSTVLPEGAPANPQSDKKLSQWFAEFAGQEGAVLLESSLSAYGRGGRTFAAVNPADRWAIDHNQRIPADWRSQLDSFLSDETAFYALFFSYDFGAELIAGLNENSADGISARREYKALALKYPTVKVLESSSGSPRQQCLPAKPAQSETQSETNIVRRPDRRKYLADVARIAEHIFEGDIYQANLTAEWIVESESSPWDVYCRLRALNPSQYGGYANLGRYTILCSSPERLLTVSDGCIVANPIKGTIATGSTQAETQRNIAMLQSSEKDCAELLMIVDLLRNDLGKICKTGSVRTRSLWRPEVYSSVAHLVAEITGELCDDVSVSQIVSAVFPGGSITGAPKRRAVRILQEIEKRRRGIYTGSFGFKCGSTLDLNIAIRTLTYQPGVEESAGLYHVQAGGGIVADSDPCAEYEEACLKARNVLKAIDMELEP